MSINTKEQKVGENKLRRLAYIKGLFRTGINNLDIATEPNVALTTLIFDDCIEMMLWLLVDVFSIKLSRSKDEVYAPQLLKIVGEEMDKNQTSNVISENAGDIQELHRARNSVQHHGIIPSLQSVQRYKAITELLLARLTKDAMALSWDSVSMALLIVEPVARELYTTAEQEYENKRYTEAALRLVTAFEYMKAKETLRRSGSGILMKRIDVSEVHKTDDKHIKSLIQYTHAIESEVEILKLGIDYKSFQRYRDFIDISPLDHVSLSGSPNDMLSAIKKSYSDKSRFINKDLELQDWLMFAFYFVLDCMFRWQLTRRPGLYEAFSNLPR